MKIEPTPNVTPQSSPPAIGAGSAKAVDERFLWETLVPRLIHPSKLAIIQLLVSEDRPLSSAELADALQITTELARYHCKSMERTGVLEAVASTPPSDGGGGEEASYFFPEPPRAISPPSHSPPCQ